MSTIAVEPVVFTKNNKDEDLSIQILSDISVHMKYARYLPDKMRRETFEEIVTRNKTMHIEKYPELEAEINKAYQYVYDKKVLPSMRSMQFAGKSIDVNPVRIFNCSYLPVTHPDAFSETMFLLLSGVGVGWSVQKQHIKKLPPVFGVIQPEGRQRKKRYLIGDSIEGWADAIKVLVESYFYGKRELDFDFRDIRPKGADLVTSGGKAPGPQPLREALVKIQNVFENAIQERGRGTHLKTIEAHDILCYISDAVLAGGIRRAAAIAGFSFDDYEMRSAKSGSWWESNPQRARANNSAVMVRDKIIREEFDKFWKTIELSGSGEPGIFFTSDPNGDWFGNPCFTGDTVVATADGRNGVTIEQLALESQGNKMFPVYSARGAIQNKTRYSSWKTEIKNAVALKTGTKEVVEVILSDGTTFRCTPEHKLATKDGRWVEAQNSEGKFLERFLNENPEPEQKDENTYFDEPIFVKEVIWTGEIEDVYDLTVEDNHNFYILTKTDDDQYMNSSGVLVHNCMEVSLRPFQFCNLTEINASNVSSQEDLNNRAWSASFIGTLQASYTDFHYLRDEWRDVTEKGALIGVSMTGIGSGAVLKYDLKEAANVVKKTNFEIANKIGINPAARTTVVKPSGTTSLVFGTSSGIHAWYDKYYVRRIRVGKNESIYQYLFTMHPELVEDELFRPETTAVIGVPQKAPKEAIFRSESPLETLERVKRFNSEWIGQGHRKGVNKNNVSCTINIKENEWDEVGSWLWENRGTYTGVSVLPYDNGIYQQAPFETITKEHYNELVKSLYTVDLTKIIEEKDETDLQGEAACAGGACEIV